MQGEKNDRKARIITRLESSQKYKSDFIGRCADLNRYYRGKFKQKIEGRSAIWVPYSLAIVESQLPRFVGNRPKIEYEAMRREFQPFTRALNVQFQNDWMLGRMPLKMVDAAKMNLMFGFVGGYVPWVIRQRRVRERSPMTFMGFNLPFMGYRPADKTVFEGPMVLPVSPWRLFWDDEATNEDDAGWLGHFERISKDRIDRAIASKSWSVDPEQRATWDRTMAKADKWDRVYAYHYHEDEYSAILLYLDFQREGLTFKKHGEPPIDQWQNVAGESGAWFMVREDDLPYDDGEKPYVVARNIPLVEEFEGLGDLELIEGQQKELNIIRSVRLDNVNAAMNRMFIVHQSANIDPQDLVFRPNGTITVRGMSIHEALRELPVSDLKNAGPEAEQAIKGDIHIATGQWETRLGQETQRNERTATALIQAQESADVRIQMKLSLFEQMFLEPIGRKYLARNRQFITQDKVVKTLGSQAQEWFTITPEQLAGEYIPIVHSRSTEPNNRQLKIQEIMTFMNILRSSPELKEYFDPAIMAQTIRDRFGLENVPGLSYTQQQVDARRAAAEELRRKMAANGGGISAEDVAAATQQAEAQQGAA